MLPAISAVVEIVVVLTSMMMLPRCVQAAVLVLTSVLLLMITVGGSQLPACPDDGVVHHINSNCSWATRRPLAGTIRVASATQQLPLVLISNMADAVVPAPSE
jgi:hypothetical protein